MQNQTHFLFYDAWVPNLLLLVIDQSSLTSKLFQVHWEVDLNRTKNDLLPSRKSRCSVQHKSWKLQKLRLSLSTLFCKNKKILNASALENDIIWPFTQMQVGIWSTIACS